MPVTCDEDHEQYSICLQAEIDIRSAAELKATLLEAIASRKEVRIDLQRATEFDVTAVQLLWAAAREAERGGVPLSFAGQGSEALAHAASEMGLDSALRGSIEVAAVAAAGATAERNG